MTTYIYDNVIIGNNHLILSASLATAFLQINSRKEEENHVKFFSEKTLFQIFSKKIDSQLTANNTLEHVEIKVTDVKGSPINKAINWAQKVYTDGQVLKKFVKEVNQNKPDFVLFTTQTPINFFLYRNLFAKINQPIYFILHGDIELLFSSSKDKKDGYKIKFLDTFLSNCAPNCRFLVFNDVSKNDLIKKYPHLNNRIFTFLHPIVSTLKIDFNPQQINTNTVKIGMLGVANARKGSDKFFTLAEQLRSQIDKQKLEMLMVGKIESTITLPNNCPVTPVAKDNKSIQEETFQSVLKNLHYGIFFFPEEEYKYRFSGSLLDIIQYELPIISLPHDAVTEMFETGGNIGYICKDLAEMKILIERLSTDFPTEEYALQRENLKKLKAKYSIEQLSNTFLDIKSHEA